MLFSLIAISIPGASHTRTMTGPGIQEDAPTSLEILEDSKPYYMDLYDIFVDTGGSLNFTIWTGEEWGDTFKNENITIEILINDTIEFTPEQDKYGVDKIEVKAVNPQENYATHELTVSILSVNDLPVIEKIGKIDVSDSDKVKLYASEDELYNITVEASDVDGDSLVFLDNCPLFDIGYLTGAISFVPTNDDVGTHNFNLTVSDIEGPDSEDKINVALNILNVNDPPTAYILYPENESELYYDYYLYFQGEGEDPDLQYGDKLTFEWYSDIDGDLGEGEELEVYYLSEGKHTITLTVTDFEGQYDTDSIVINIYGYYPKYNEIGVSIDNNYIVLKQNEGAVCEMTVTNYGYSEDNVTFEIKNYLDFPGSVDLEYENITLDSYESGEMNVTISTKAETPIGFYPLNIYAISAYFDEYEYYYDGYFAFDTIYIIIMSNSSQDGNKEAPKPFWEIGYTWEYDVEMIDSSSGFNVDGSINLEVTEDTTKEVEDKEYDVYVMDMDAKLEMDEDSYYGGYYGNIRMEIDGADYIQKSDLATVMSEYDIETIISYGDYQDEYYIEDTTTYDPPINQYDFPLKPGDSWTASALMIEETMYDYDYDKDWDYNEEDVSISYLCLGTETVKVEAGTFETYLVLSFYNEYDYDDTDWDNKTDKPDNDGNRITRSSIFDDVNTDTIYIEYYSPEINFTVKQDSYTQDYFYDSREPFENYGWYETEMMELTSYSLGDADSDPDGNTDTDIDNDGMADDWEDEYDIADPDEDPDNDGYTNYEEYLNGTDPTNKNDSPDDPIDSDSDGMPDAWEDFHDLDPNDPSDAGLDPDKDGFDNLDEYEWNTFPNDPVNHPPVETEPPAPDESEDDSIFGLGKLGSVDLAYMYMVVIIAILALLIFAIFVHRSKRKRERVTDELPKDEPRVPAPIVPGTLTATPDQAPTLKPHDPKYLQNVKRNKAAPKQPAVPPPPPGQEPQPPYSYTRPVQPAPPPTQYPGSGPQQQPYYPPPPPPPDYNYNQPRQNNPYYKNYR